VIVVHSSHLRCGIAEYGRQLDAAMAGLGAWIEPCTFDSAAGALPVVLRIVVPSIRLDVLANLGDRADGGPDAKVS
jgi:hypothetical protein